MRRARSHRLLPVIAIAGAAALALVGCTGSSSGSGADSDSIDYALPANFTPNWILPIGTAAHLNTNNGSIAASLWEPLVAYDGSTGGIRWNHDGSIASDVTFADDGTSATVTLKKRTWSDGKPITSRDVEFWYNLIVADKGKWASYNEGKAPDNWTSFQAADDRHFTLTFDRAYNTQWMLANELSLITPLPQHAWDRTSASGSVGDADRTTAGAKKVWTYLNDAAKNISGYAKNPLWKVVSGPYSLESFSTAGRVTLAKNTKYDGDEAASIATVNLLPFTTSEAEVNALRSGQVDYGYIAPTDLDQRQSFTSRGYDVKPWSGWAITYMPYNFNNPTMGPVFSQLYARQAVQMSIDQASLAKVVYGGTAEPGYGPVPQGQASDFVSDAQKDDPYPFSTSKATALLTDHGWSRNSDGIMTCTEPGSGAGECGQGVASGTEFSMTVLGQSGSTVTDNMMSAVQSSLEKTGIGFDISTAPVNSVLSRTPQCTSDQSICSWQLSYFGTAGSWYFPAYPTGDSLFQTRGGSNFGNYSNPDVDSLITATTTSTDPGAIKDYSAALAKDLPVIWLPNPDYQISVIRDGLTGFSQDSLADFHPAQWSWGK